MSSVNALQTLRESVVSSAKDKKQIASEAGISRKTLYDLLEGHKDPRWSTVEAVAQVLGLRFHVAPSLLGPLNSEPLARSQYSVITRILEKSARLDRTRTK